MPIVGLTDRNEGSFPQIGVIRKGAPKTQNAPGKDLQFWRVEFDEKEVKAAQDFVNKFGNAPTDITIMLPFNEIGRCWEAWRETYVAGALVHRCDGEHVQYAINPKTGERLVVNGIGPNGQPVLCKGNADGCKPSGRLRVIVPELQRLAYLMVLTTSIHDCKSISDQLYAISALTGGRLAGIPLVLRRRPRKISTPSGEGGKRARREKWLISIEADPEWVKAQLAKMHRDALPGNGFEKLPAPTAQAPGPDWAAGIGDEDDDDEDELPMEGEFSETSTASESIAEERATIVQIHETRRTDAWPAAVITWAVQELGVKTSYQVVGALNQSHILTDKTTPDEIKHLLAVRKTERDAGAEGEEATGRADADYLATHGA